MEQPVQAAFQEEHWSHTFIIHIASGVSILCSQVKIKGVLYELRTLKMVVTEKKIKERKYIGLVQNCPRMKTE